MLPARDGPYPDKWDSCQKKQGYDTVEEAKRVASRARDKSGDNSIMEYPCEYCWRWHIGHYTL